MRIISLVPNATEILFALGVGDLVVGVSHECDHPPEAAHLPQLTGSALAPDLAPAEIDRAVGEQLGGSESLYTLDEERITELAPTLIVTQTLCPVCAVSTEQVDGAIRPLSECPEVVSLDPKTLEDVFRDIRAVGDAVGRPDAASDLVAGLEYRLERVRTAARGRRRPRLAALEWLDPPFVAGHWIPEMIEIAGGEDVFAQAGDPSRRVDWNEIAEADPELIVAMPCGFDRSGSAEQVEAIATNPVWRELRAVKTAGVVPVDANGCFSRPGPRLVDGIEELARIFGSRAA